MTAPADWTEDARLEEIAGRATPQGEVETVDRDGVPTYRVHGAPCGFPIARFGDHADLDLFRAAKAHLPRLLRERREAVELLDDWLMAHELPGNHCERDQCAERTRALLSRIHGGENG
jgi:hypothetical protein